MWRSAFQPINLFLPITTATAKPTSRSIVRELGISRVRQLGFYGVQFGDSNDKLVPADYDGDGKADVAVFRPSNGTLVYYSSQRQDSPELRSESGLICLTPADYDGDGKADVAVFRSSKRHLVYSTLDARLYRRGVRRVNR